VIPPSLAIAHMLGRFSWRTAIGALCIGLPTTALAIMFKAIGTAQHEPEAMLAIALAIGITILATIDRTIVQRAAGATGLRAEAAAIAVIAFTASTILPLHFFGPYRDHLGERLIAHVIRLRLVNVVGSDQDAQRDVRRLQDAVPAHAHVGFWGQSAAQLDFRHNPIRDLSWPAGSRARHLDEYLSPLEPASLRGLDYVIVEDVATAPQNDRWGAVNATAVSEIIGLVEPVAMAGRARLYRVRQAR
jgi:hypothetical protein